MKAIILAGGSGTRLFPLSRRNLPKQFLKIWGEKSLFQQTIERVLKVVKNKQDILILTNKDYLFHVIDQLREINILEEEIHIITEPVIRNTAPAIALAVKFLTEKTGIDHSEILFVTPSDHLISPVCDFIDYINQAKKLSEKGYLVTFGIKPTKPETGYGYIELGESLDIGFKVKRFHEKPSFEKAVEYLNKGNFYWNSGMFTFSVKAILEEFNRHCKDLYEMVKDNTYEDLIENFHNMPEISIDYAVMGKTDRAVVIPMDITWSDIGSWDSLYEVMPKDNRGNVKIGKVIDVNTKDTMIIGNKRLIAVVEVENLIVVETEDVILIAKRDEGQKVREVVNRLKENKELSHLVDFHTIVYRPWGSYTDFEKGERYKIKKSL